MKKIILVASIFCSLSESSVTFADQIPPNGVVAAIKNNVRALRNPSPDPRKDAKYPQVKFNGKYYDSYPLTKQSPLFKGDIITTLQRSHVKLILKDGDVIILGPESQYELVEPPKVEDKKQDNLDIKLWYGKVRSIIKKQAEGSEVHVRSPNAVVGVRGTDFYTEYDILTRKTKTAPLHGKVEIQSIKTVTTKTNGQEVKTEQVSTEKEVVEEGRESTVQTNKDQVAAAPTTPQLIQATTISNAVFISEFNHQPDKEQEKEANSESRVTDENFKALEVKANETIIENTKHLELEEGQDPLTASIKKYETTIRKMHKKGPPWNERIFNWMKNSL